MSYLVRFPVDLLLPDTLSSEQAREIQEKLKDYAGSVLGMTVVNKTITETKPYVSYHLHDGSNNCTNCRENAQDERNARSVSES